MKVELIQSILSRNNYTLQISEEKTYSLKQTERDSSIVMRYFAFAVSLLVLAILLFLLHIWLWGILLLVTFVPVYLVASKRRKKQWINFNNNLTMRAGLVEIIQNNKTCSVDTDSFEAINYEISQNKNVCTGIIVLRTDEGEAYTVVEIYGDNKRYVEHDIQQIAQFIADVINGENS